MYSPILTEGIEEQRDSKVCIYVGIWLFNQTLSLVRTTLADIYGTQTVFVVKTFVFLFGQQEKHDQSQKCELDPLFLSLSHTCLI